MHDNMVSPAVRHTAHSTASAVSRGIRVLETAAVVLGAVYTAAKMVEHMTSVAPVRQNVAHTPPPLSLEMASRVVPAPPAPPVVTGAPKQSGWSTVDPASGQILSADGRLF